MSAANLFKPATKEQARARVGLSGPAGSGKTYTALALATAMCEKVAVIDTEHGSASKYADEFQFDVLELTDFHPDKYVEAIHAAEAAGYDGLVIDSITHEWSGFNGCLQLVDMYAKKLKGNSYVAWGEVTPIHNRFIEAILGAKLHIIATVRSKMDYLQTEVNGKKTVQKVGLAPVTRDGVEYEFDIMGEIDLGHELIITKSRAKALADTMWRKPGQDLADAIKGWLTSGAPMTDKPEQPRLEVVKPQTPAPAETPSPKANPLVDAGFSLQFRSDIAKWLGPQKKGEKWSAAATGAAKELSETLVDATKEGLAVEELTEIVTAYFTVQGTPVNNAAQCILQLNALRRSFLEAQASDESAEAPPEPVDDGLPEELPF